MPYALLYLLSDGLYLLLHNVLKYRKNVVAENLRNSFPTKTVEELDLLERKFYRHLCDLMVESIKMISWSQKDIRKRVKFEDRERIKELLKNGRALFVLGHTGNWEWCGPAFSIQIGEPLSVVYEPLHQAQFEKVLYKARTRFGTKLIPRKETLRRMVAERNSPGATVIIADQAPTPVRDAHWLQFLNQETAVFTGPEKLAIKFKLPVYYFYVHKVKRGYYSIRAELINDQPELTKEHEITEQIYKALERDLIENPVEWLWSHKRWKHKRQ